MASHRPSPPAPMLIETESHINEHEILQVLQRHALNGQTEEFYQLLKEIPGEDKRRDIIELCRMNKVI